MKKYLRFLLLVVLLHAPATIVRGDEADASPKALLSEALKLARELPATKGYGNWRGPLLMLRIGETLRVHGLTDEAAAAYGACKAANARLTFEAERDEIAVEMCRDLTLLGRTAEARSLAKEIKFRNYGTAALFVIARTALEMGNSAEAEAAMRDAPALKGSAKAEKGGTDDLWTRAMAGLAVRVNKLDLARSLTEAIRSEPWKSGALGDLATALARAGQPTEALKLAGEIPDPYMAALASARLAAVFSDSASAEPSAAAMAALRKQAVKIKNETERDFALLLAVRRLSGVGNAKDLAGLAADIKNPCLAALARCELLTKDTFAEATNAIAGCPDADRDLLWEVLGISAGRNGMADAAMDTSSRITDPWQQLRARCSASRELTKAGVGAEATRLLNAASESVSRLDRPGWRCCAHVRLAIACDEAKAGEQVDKHLGLTKDRLSEITDAELRAVLLPRLVEAMVALDRKEAAKAIITEALKAEPKSALRDRLVVQLAEAGDPAGALAEHTRARLSGFHSRRVLLYRLAQSGQVQQAVECAKGFSPPERAEALADIARAQVQSSPQKPRDEKAVGVCLHGSWGSWFPRLERMGVRWELMPFFEPYEIGAEGLKAKYIALGYPGTGGHLDHLSAIGVENVREYLHSGGGFVGICAGQFLATQGAFVACDTNYLRGQGPHQVQMRKNHPIALGLPPVIVIVRHNGGMLLPKPGCEAIGWYDKVDHYAALVAEEYGRGRVVAFSPHPEGSSGLDPRDFLCINALNWAMTGLP